MSNAGKRVGKELFRDDNPAVVHFIGVCGTAMAGVAAELHRAGFRVTGSDSAFYPPAGDYIREAGLPVSRGYAAGNLPADGLVVVGNALSRGNPEIEAALERNLTCISLPELVARRYLPGRRPVVIAGTHGKSTTTAMTTHILKAVGRRPGWLVGAWPLDLDNPCEIGDDAEFVVEGDEYDSAWFDKRPKLFHYRPRFGVINAVEFDHSDIYGELKDVMAVFAKFADLLPEGGRLFVNGDDLNAVEVSRGARCPVVTVGSGDGCDWRFHDVTARGGKGASAEFRTPGGEREVMELQLPGAHNLRNALVSLAVAVELGVEPSDCMAALKSFRGVARRLELVAETNGYAVWDDFAHHPTAVQQTLSGLRRRYPGHRIWALFEPRSNTMVRNYLQGELVAALSLADLVVLGKVHRRERVPEESRLDTEAVVNELINRGVTAAAVEDNERIPDFVRGSLEPGDVIVLMSNGDFDGLRERIMEIVAA